MDTDKQMNNKPKEKWEKRFEKLIIKQLFLAWKAGKKQVKTPYEYTLDTDKLGRPIFDMAVSRFKQKLKEQREELRKRCEKRLRDIKDLNEEYDKKLREEGWQIGYTQAREDFLERK